MSNLPADPAAPVIGRQLAVSQHLRVKEVVLQQHTTDATDASILDKLRFPQDADQAAFKFLTFCPI